MTVYPQSYLPPKSQPWGRSIESELINNREALRLNNLNTENNLKQLNSNIELVSRQQLELESQQNYLSSFKTYLVQSLPEESAQNVTTPEVTYKSINLSFVLDRQATLLVSAKADISVNVTATVLGDNNTLNPSSDAWIGIDGAAAERQSSTGTSIRGRNIQCRINDAVEQTKIVTLQAGPHTINAFWKLRYFASIPGGTGIASYSAANAILTATVVA
jgi:hypothetical protein